MRRTADGGKVTVKGSLYRTAVSSYFIENNIYGACRIGRGF